MRVSRIAELKPEAEASALLIDLQPKHLEKLLEIAEEWRFGQDDIMFGEGAKSERLFLIMSGRVALEIVAVGRGIVVQTLGAGDAMGWSALTETARTHFQARALSPVQAIAFDGAKLSVSLEYDHDLGYEMMKRLLAMVTERLDHTRMQVIDMYGKPGGAHR